MCLGGPLITKLVNLIFGLDDAESDAERSHLLAWQRSQDATVTPAFYLPVTVGAIFAVVANYFFASQITRVPLITIFSLIFMLAACIPLASRIWPKKIQRVNSLVTFLAGQTALIGMSFVFKIDIATGGRLDYAVMSSGIYCCLGILTIIISPFHHGFLFFLTAEFIALGMFSWGVEHPFERTIAWLLVLLSFASVATAYHIIAFRRLRLHAKIEWTKRVLQQQNERLRMNAIERELTVARQVQDSLSPAITTLDCSHATVRVYQRRFDILGGDWVGVKLDKSGQLILAIADVTGKGIPAAMVAQTINSLWALALTEDIFEPVQWIKQVNSTLIMLGHSAPHTATLGVLIVDDTSADYYSCGHLPVFVANGFTRGHRNTSDEHVVFNSMPSRGNLVGLFDELDLKPVKISFSETPVESLLLGTDGIFNQGGRIKRRKIQDLLYDLDQRGDQALNRANVDDDQLLIWIERKTAINKAA